MITDFSPIALAVFVIGGVTLLATLGRAGFERIGLPGVVAYLLIGLALGAAHQSFGLLNGELAHGLEVLAATGVVILLFRIGLESNPTTLLQELPAASVALIGSIVPSAALGYLSVRYLLGAPVLPALFVSIALTATSLGVSLAVWRDLGALDTREGALLLDLGELDDIAAVVLLALLLSLTPFLRDGRPVELGAVLLAEGGGLVVKLALLATLCLLFALFVERRLTRWLGRVDAAKAPVVPVAGLGFMFAGLAGVLGFSLAIGALFAGLAFTRDPHKVRLDHAFETLSRFFVPFFFVGIGVKVDIGQLGPAVGGGLLLLAVAVVAKVGGTAIPVLASVGAASALVVGVSTVPRAEIAMIVMERGLSLGEWAVPAELYGAMVFVALCTCLLTPPVVRYLLLRQRRRTAVARRRRGGMRHER